MFSLDDMQITIDRLQEQVRRQNLQDRRLRASALARGAASGAEVGSGSVATEMQFMEDEQAYELNWLKTAGASKIRLQLQGDKLRAGVTIQQGQTQQWSSVVQGLTSAFMFADAGGMFTTSPSGFNASSYNAPGFERR